MKSHLVLLGLLIGTTCVIAKEDSASRSLQVVPSVDLNRYAGTWYEIARMPFKYQEQCVGDVTATYTVLEDGTVHVVNRCRATDGEMDDAVGKARRLSEDEPNTKLEVRFAPAILSFLPFVWGNYWIIDLAEDYSYSIVGEPNREYLWILCRTPKMDDAVYERLRGKVTELGYDATRLIKTRQGQ